MTTDAGDRASSPSRPGRSNRNRCGSPSRSLGWVSLAAGLTLWSRLSSRASLVPLRRGVPALRLRRGRGHLRGRHRPGRLPVEGAGQPRVPLRGQDLLRHLPVALPPVRPARLGPGAPLSGTRCWLSGSGRPWWWPPGPTTWSKSRSGGAACGRSPSGRRGWPPSGAFLAVVLVTVAATLPSTAEAADAVRVVGAQYSGPPVKVAIFGDSVAWRMGFAMLASQPQASYDVNIDNGAIVGCGVVRSSQYQEHGVAYNTAPACNTATPPASQWPALWHEDLEQFHPDVVVVLAGRWEVHDRLDRRPLDAHRRAGVRRRPQAVPRTGRPGRYVDRGAGGAHDLALLRARASRTTASRGRRTPPPGWPQYNADGPCGGGRAPGHGPGGRLRWPAVPRRCVHHVFNGVQVRDGDGVHIAPTPAAGQWLDAHVLPEVVRVGRLQMAGRDLLVPSTAGSAATTAPVPLGLVECGHSAGRAGAATPDPWLWLRGMGPWPRGRERDSGGGPWLRGTERREPVEGSTTGPVLAEGGGVGGPALCLQRRYQRGLRHPAALGHRGHEGLVLSVVHRPPRRRWAVPGRSWT